MVERLRSLLSIRNDKSAISGTVRGTLRYRSRLTERGPGGAICLEVHDAGGPRLMSRER